jgi:hypothetical protein
MESEVRNVDTIELNRCRQKYSCCFLETTITLRIYEPQFNFRDIAFENTKSFYDRLLRIL